MNTPSSPPDKAPCKKAGTPPTQAVALRYDPSWRAPHVVAKGYGFIGAAIIETARAHDVVVTESPALVEQLMRIELDREIPPELYVAVAEILVWLARLEAAGTDPGTPPSDPAGAPGADPGARPTSY